MLSSYPPPIAISEGAPAGRLIVCEAGDRWAAALLRELAAAGVRVYQTRTLADAWEALAAAPASFLAVEVSAGNLRDFLRRMVWFSRDFPAARVAVVAARRLVDGQGLIREAGAIHFVLSPRHLAPLAELAIRHLANLPLPPQTLVERIWTSLPWKEKG
jgi:hypothetical protein